MARTARDEIDVTAAALIEAERGDVEMAFRLALTELQPGARGEVVLFNDSAFRGIVIEAARPYETGSVKAHVTAEGVDVSGFRFVRFDHGLVVYHAPDTELSVVPA